MDDAAAHPTPTLADLTTFRVGGPVARLVEADTESALVEAVSRADAAGTPCLVLGGGSNLLASDSPFPGVVVRDLRGEITHSQAQGAGPICDPVLVTATAGTPWDALVAHSVEQGLSGLEALSGIPGSVGAAPVQNVGAYGAEVADTLVHLRAWDRFAERVVTLEAAELDFGYRMSVLKRSLENPSPARGGRLWGPTGRWAVLEATFGLAATGHSAPIRYAELARRLGVEVGAVAPSRDVREAVLELRASKGMVLDAADHDTWSAGSFFTNPVLDPEAAERLLPEGAPRFPTAHGQVKTSAAWLIDHAGLPKGWAPESVCDDRGVARASLSTKHVLALTNRGGASAADVEALARAVITGVEDAWGITLVPEPVALGITW
ncbi:UDP-N-acetylmuramate dehydrogenase [Schaalia sp. 19OD2882]|uniref:UDP-N-acetylmuramate dehydrogenase n=1 Tax=Schaalia sp. 19OD2882 TaxID=2794089 RepID=UPI001C1EC192|nr:UDP-N-acetylmuramate dehydrogenase [Schaalia sp. 19OD2882]QWW19294.1 UDP-N-acetylmuramate dehydrogenase [Schaalia sp. 19OD2882]